MLTAVSSAPVLNAIVKSRGLTPASSGMSEVSDCQTQRQRLVGDAVVDHRSSVKARMIGDFDVEQADGPSPVLASVENEQGQVNETDQPSGPAAAEPSEQVCVKLACDVCDATFLYLSRLKTHMQSHDERALFSCDDCGGDFKYKSNLNRHRRTLHDETHHFACSVCSWRFATNDKLQNHIEMHKTSRLPECPECSITCGSGRALHIHMATRHSGVYDVEYAAHSGDSGIKKRKSDHCTHVRHEKQCKSSECNNTQKSPLLLRQRTETCHDQQTETEPMTRDEHQPSTSNACVNKS